MMTDKEKITQDLKAVSDDIYNAFSGKPAKIPAVNLLGIFVNGIRTLNPFGAIFDNKYKHR